MSKGLVRLSLGALPRAETVKLMIAVPVELKVQLDAYAEVHSRLHGAVDAVGLIPHMLAAFIARDRGFKAMRANPPSPVRLAQQDRNGRGENSGPAS